MSGRRGTPWDQYQLAENGLYLTDNTIGDVSTSAHGFAPKLPNDATKFLNGVGGYTVPGAASSVTFAGARVYNNANITVTTGTAPALTFNSERFDTDGFHSTVTNTDRLTIPSGKAGYYHIGASVAFASATQGQRVVAILVNGTGIVEDGRQAVQSGVTYISLEAPYLLAVGDILTCLVFHDRGSNLDVSALGNVSPEFWCYLVGT